MSENVSEYILIADFFTRDGILGGGELNNDELTKHLKCQEINCHHLTLEFLQQNKDKKFIIANFVRLREENKKYITENLNYVIYEHDHKYLYTRDPGQFKDFLVPKELIINKEFYSKAKRVLCQSNFHKKIVEKNLQLKNIVSLGGNLWSEQSFSLMEELSESPKSKNFAIMDSDIAHKNTALAVSYCEMSKIPFELVKSSDYDTFIRKLGSCKGLVFFPKTPETLSRIAVEARMMNLEVKTNKFVGASQEHWYRFKGKALIEFLREKQIEIVNIVKESFL